MVIETGLQSTSQEEIDWEVQTFTVPESPDSPVCDNTQTFKINAADFLVYAPWAMDCYLPMMSLVAMVMDDNGIIIAETRLSFLMPVTEPRWVTARF